MTPARSRAPGSEAPNYHVAALSKGLAILSLFSFERRSLSTTEIVGLSGIPMPTVFRLVSTLEASGYLERADDGRLRPGTGVLGLGFAALRGMDLVDKASGPLQALARETGETVNLGVLSGKDVLIVARRQRPVGLMTADIGVGTYVSAVFGSLGRALLAYLPAKERAKRVSAQAFVGRFGPHAIRTRAEFEEKLEDVRRLGYSLQEQEVSPGMSSIAAPIRQLGGDVVAALNVAVPSIDYPHDRLIDAFKDPLLETARDISIRLGASPEDPAASET